MLNYQHQSKLFKMEKAFLWNALRKLKSLKKTQWPTHEHHPQHRTVSAHYPEHNDITN